VRSRGSSLYLIHIWIPATIALSYAESKAVAGMEETAETKQFAVLVDTSLAKEKAFVAVSLPSSRSLSSVPQHQLLTFSIFSSGRLPVLPGRFWCCQMSQRIRDQHTKPFWKWFLFHSETNEYFHDRGWQCQLCGYFEELFQPFKYHTVARLDW